MDRSEFDEEISEKFVLSLITALAQGPIGQALLELAEGRRRIVVKQHATKSGWVIETEGTALDSAGESYVPYRTYLRAAAEPGVEPADQADAPLGEPSMENGRYHTVEPRIEGGVTWGSHEAIGTFPKPSLRPSPETRLSDPARDWCPNVDRLPGGPKTTVCAGCSPGPCQLSTGGMDRF